MKINIKKLDEKAIIPTYATNGDAGADLYALEGFVIHGGEPKMVGTGIALEIVDGYFGLIRPRSGLATKLGIGMNSSGVIDAGYRGEIKVNLFNYSNVSHIIEAGTRIAQLIILPFYTAQFNVVDDLNDSVRGANGHGSTGMGV